MRRKVQKDQVERLTERDGEVRAHEMAHLAAAGSLAQGGMKLTYQTGPDGRQYAVGGSVKIDTSEARPQRKQSAKHSVFEPLLWPHPIPLLKICKWLPRPVRWRPGLGLRLWPKKAKPSKRRIPANRQSIAPSRIPTHLLKLAKLIGSRKAIRGVTGKINIPIRS